MTTVLVDAENVRRPCWPNLPRTELVARCRCWAAKEGLALLVVFDGPPAEDAPDLVTGLPTADDWLARHAAERAPYWLVTSDRELRRRAGAGAERGSAAARSSRSWPRRTSVPAMAARPRRTCLTVPGASARMLAKAPSLGADEVIVDLEDGVAEPDKQIARKQGARAVAAGLARTTALRVNGLKTPWWEEDLAAAATARPDVVVVPKVESPDELAAVAERLPPGTGIEAQIETARGLAEVERIAAAGHGLEALVFGPADFAASVGVPVLTIGAGTFDYALARIAVAARAHGLQPIDGPWAVVDDEDGLVASARRGLAHGFDGKWVVHPSQIGPVNAIFTPSDEDVARAERLLASAGGAVRLDGELVDAASLRLAEALLARSRAGPV